jgi:hypothetical protein
MTESTGFENSIKSQDALTKADYEKIRATHEAKVRAELAKESEKDRQKRIWAEDNARRNGELGS